MLEKHLAHNPQFLSLARRLLDISEEKASLAAEFAEFHNRYVQRLQELNSKAEKTVDEFNFFYAESQLNVGDG